jgi:hypothetical protein
MLRLWAFLSVLFVAYGVWMVAAAPVGERLVSAIPFLFWILLFGGLTIRSARHRAIDLGRGRPKPGW